MACSHPSFDAKSLASHAFYQSGGTYTLQGVGRCTLQEGTSPNNLIFPQLVRVYLLYKYSYLENSKK